MMSPLLVRFRTISVISKISNKEQDEEEFKNDHTYRLRHSCFMAHELELKVASETSASIDLLYCGEIPEDWKQKADEDRNSSNEMDRERKETWSDSTIGIAR